MKALELVNELCQIINRNKSRDEDVVIRLNGPYMGIPLSTEIDELYQGIDFEKDKIVVLTKDTIISDSKDRDIISPPFETECNNGKVSLSCSRCANKVKKDFVYCPYCGQRIK